MSKYESSGSQAWASTFSSANTQYTHGVATGGSGNVYAAGYTYEVFAGQSLSGATSNQDAFVVSYNSSGMMNWARQFGTGTYDSTEAVAADSAGNSYSAGYTLGSYPGETDLGAHDAFLRKYDSAGNAVWTRQFGTSSQDTAQAVAVDGSGNIFVAGDTYGTFPGQNYRGLLDGFVTRFDSSGTALWTRQFGTDANEFVKSIALDSSGNVFVAGETYGIFSVPFPTNGGMWDVFVCKYDNLGNHVWTWQYGTIYDDHAGGVALDSSGNIYVSGYTRGTFPGYTLSGYWDAFLIKLGDVVYPTPTPEPSPTPFPSPFPSPSPEPSPTGSPTPGPTPTPVPSPTPTPGPSPSPSPGGTPTLTPTPGPSLTPTPTPSFLPGDVNRDGRVDTADLTLLVASFNKRTGDAGFNPDADCNGNGIVDIYDLVIVGLNFGRTG